MDNKPLSRAVREHLGHAGYKSGHLQNVIMSAEFADYTAARQFVRNLRGAQGPRMIRKKGRR